ncbi:MAG: pseudouridine-5'-phosphate glycosidase [Woeseia sp.]
MTFDISAEVSEALAAGRPVVALETTVITHGMSFPDNLEIAVAMEEAVQAEQACPATIGIVKGRVTVGMQRHQIEAFAKAGRKRVLKCSRRDLPAVIASGADGSLTVAGTVAVAFHAGIRLVATGGIGGVHRDRPQDVSADLYELGRTPVVCVCSGAKSILDLAATMEVLESLGVPVIGLGTSNLPAFIARDSGIPLTHYANSVDETADVLRAWKDFDSTTGLLVTIPVPENFAVPAEEAEIAIREAVLAAAEQGISGSALTPYILQHVATSTDHRSTVANKALLLNNARTAARLARASGLGQPDGRI